MGKIRRCSKCYNYAYVFVGGDVRICPWNEIVIGNLLENTLEEIWNGEAVEKIRDAFTWGELLGCHENTCPDCINDWESIHISEEEMLELKENRGNIPEYLSLAYDERCNHACPSCRTGIMKVDKQYIEQVRQITAHVSPYINHVKQLITNGIGDLFVTTEIVELLENLKPVRPDFSLFIETNGVLFKANWSKLEHLSRYPITVSVTPNSFDRATYKYLAGGIDDLDKFEESMQFLMDLKHQGKISRIRLIMVVQDTNFRQIPEFVRRGIAYDADDIVLRSLFHWFGLKEDLWLYKNVLNPCHPYHQEYLEILKDPICQNSRVLDWGYDVIQKPVEFPTLEMKRAYYGDQELQAQIDDCLSHIRCQLVNQLEENQNAKLIIYGVGKVGKYVMEKLTCGDQVLPVRGFMVECKACNPGYWMGYEVKEPSAYKENRESDVVLIALTRENQTGVMEMLRKEEYQHIIAIDEGGSPLK